mmetsp:Transcript_24072/g.78377  ORF Transcript_24072/g.78377 Transcript_24072/m.78377 type:complete len:251 (-) Transcript_24072:200-952(-)
MLSSFSPSELRRMPCNTVLSARAPVAEKHAMKPVRLKRGSDPEASTMPTTTGTSVKYVSVVSRCERSSAEKSAVNSGVVAPMAWLKLTGMKRSEMLPPTTEAQNTTANSAIFPICFCERTYCRFTIWSAAVAYAQHVHETIWHSVRNTGYLNPYTERRYLFRSNTPMFAPYQMAMIATELSSIAAEFAPTPPPPPLPLPLAPMPPLPLPSLSFSATRLLACAGMLFTADESPPAPPWLTRLARSTNPSRA